MATFENLETGVTFKDWRGTEMKVGSVVVYPSRQGSSLWVNEAIVTDIRVETDFYKRLYVVGKVRKTFEGSAWGSLPVAVTPTRDSQPDFGRMTVVG